MSCGRLRASRAGETSTKLVERRRVRVGSVSYLNTRPLVYSLDHHADTFDIRFDVPAVCAELLHAGQIDLGLIPSFEYLERPGYRVVPEITIASEGPVRSVALFTTRPLDRVRSVALDTSSRTSAVLLQILSQHHFGIAPTFERHAPDLPAMLARHDAALLIGDPALFAEHERLGATKLDLGEAWRAMTGLPFIWAFWAGPEHAPISPEICRALCDARDRGLAAVEEIAAAFAAGDEGTEAVAAEYLRTHIKYVARPDYWEGVRRFHALAVEGGFASQLRPVRFFGR